MDIVQKINMKRRTCIVIATLIAVSILSFPITKPNEPWYADAMSFSQLNRVSCDNITIGFIDTGISPSIAKEYGIEALYNSISPGETTDDGNGHGTAMVSIACGNGYCGVTGLAENATVVVIKAADDDGRMTLESLDRALSYAEDEGCNIVNISLGGYYGSEEVERRLRTMSNNNIAIVASSGDYAQKDLLFPSSYYPYVISVGALDETGILWEDSNTSDNLVTAFPGVNITSINIEGEKHVSSGTSEAAAMATAYIAVLKQAHIDNYGTDIDNSELVNLLKELYKSKAQTKYWDILEELIH